jgi:hypothetical protein
MEQFLKQLPARGRAVEAILVIHSFDFDGDDVKQANLDFYWQMDARRQQLKELGLVVHLVNYVGLDQVYKSTLLPFFIGMDEALQRLEDAGQINGIIALFEGAEKLAPNYTEIILRQYQKHPDLAAAESEAAFELNEDVLAPEALHAVVQHELQTRYHRFLLGKAGYPVTGSGWPYLFSIRARVYRQIDRSAWQAEDDLRHLLHVAGQLDGFTGFINEALVIPDMERPPHKNRLQGWIQKHEDGVSGGVYGVHCYQQLQALLMAIPSFYRAASLAGYQQVISQLPQAVVAYLSEVSFFEHWRAMQSQATNLERFRHSFFNWLTPGKVEGFLRFAASHFHQYLPLREAAAHALQTYLGIRSSVLDNGQMLYYLRRQARGLKAANRA